MAHKNSYEVRWKNFRGFRDTGWVELPPLTILLGVNNVGKSSFTAPLSLLAQTMSSDDASSALVTRGPYVDIGRYEDFIRKGNKRNDLFFGFRFHVHSADKGMAPIGKYPPGAVQLTFGQGETDRQPIVLKKYEIFDWFQRKYIALSRAPSGQYRPDGYKVKSLRRKEVVAIRGSRPLNFLFSTTGMVRNLVTSAGAGSRPEMARSLPSYSESFSQFLNVIGFAYSEVRGILDRTSYIGPLREQPKRYYEVRGELPISIGPHGEYAPHRFRTFGPKTRGKVNRWVKHFGLGDELRIEQHFKDVFSVMLVGEGRDVNIADIGFGASQIFPLLVQSATASNEGVIIAEQPEIHLNPRMQCGLADLLVEMAVNGKRAIVETHSEHLVLRLRRLIAEEKIKPEQVGLYFVERHGEESILRRIEIDQMGHVKSGEWPEGFFEETLNESLELAKSQARRKSRHKKNPGKRP